MHGAAKRRPDFPLALVLTLSVVVHAGAVESPSAFAQGRAQGKSSTTAAKAKPRDDVVPTAVSDMVEAIQAAVQDRKSVV